MAQREKMAIHGLQRQLAHETVSVLQRIIDDADRHLNNPVAKDPTTIGSIHQIILALRARLAERKIFPF